VKGGDLLARYRYYKKTYWKRELKGWNGSPTKGGEPFSNTDQKPAEQEGGQGLYQTETEAYHSLDDHLHPEVKNILPQDSKEEIRLK